MTTYMGTLREALGDPELKGITCFVPEQREAIINALQEFPSAKYASEWKYEVGIITYRYRVHDAKRGEELRTLLAQGKTSRHPKLTDVYALSELETILTPVSAGSH